MNRKRNYRSFSWEGANFRISSSSFDVITAEIIKQRKILSLYISGHEDFLTSLVPLAGIDKDSPDIVKRMHRASLLTGIGPMASVAGINAQIAAEAAVAAGADEAIIENGGDIYLFTQSETVIALYAGAGALAGKLAVKIKPAMTPLSICSSSSKMGHSLSLGNCDLATVTASDGALADSAATLACNLVREEEDIAPVLERIISIRGIQGALIVKNDKLGVAGKFPELIRNLDNTTEDKITREKQ